MVHSLSNILKWLYGAKFDVRQCFKSIGSRINKTEANESAAETFLFSVPLGHFCFPPPLPLYFFLVYFLYIVFGMLCIGLCSDILHGFILLSLMCVRGEHVLELMFFLDFFHILLKLHCNLSDGIRTRMSIRRSIKSRVPYLLGDGEGVTVCTVFDTFVS